MRIEELSPGQTAEMSRTVTEADVVLFAGITGDLNPMHTDQVRAEKTMFKGRIAHGMLTAGLLSAVLATKLPGPGTVYLTQSLKFTRPVRIGDTVTARAEVLEVMVPKKRVRLATTARNQHGETVLDGEALVMLTEAGDG